MTRCGERHSLSRSGLQDPAIQALITDLTNQGVNVMAPSVDIGDPADLSHELELLTNIMPPMRGCIQAAMALEVSSSSSNASRIQP